MHNTLKSLCLLLTLLSGTPAVAQDAQTLNLLLAQPGIADQFQNMAPLSGGEQSGVGMPTSDTPNPVNANDLVGDKNLIVQSQGMNEALDSVVQRYFRILSDENLPIYGVKEFSQEQDTQLLFFNTIGKAYRLAPGDIVRISLRGLSQSDASFQIGRDGNLILPDLPPFSVSGLTIAEAEEVLLDTLRYDDPSASAFMSIDTARLITVQVSGAVKTPRTIAVPAYTPLSRVLAYAGGIKPTGSLRNIILRDRDGSISEIDFYEFLQSPSGANDPLVTDSARVFVGNQGATVGAMGFVANPGIYELDRGSNEITVDDLLQLTGTTILPPGMEFEVLYFDENGITSKRSVGLADKVVSGEVLDLRFVETTLQRSIGVYGAVLDEYEMAAIEPVLLKDLLKNGTILRSDAFLDFSVLISRSGEVDTISIREKLNDPDFKIQLDTSLVIFDTLEYQNIVRADPNKSNNPIVKYLSQAQSAELFLNGEKIALLPPQTDVNFADMLQRYYRITPRTSLDLAITETADGIARAENFQAMLISQLPFSLAPGDKIHLFEDDFLAINSRLITGEQAALQNNSPQLGAWRNLSQLFARARVVRVSVDDRPRIFLPATNDLSLGTVIDIMGFEDISRFSDFAIIETLDEDGHIALSTSSILAQRNHPLGEQTRAIQLITRTNLEELIGKRDTTDLDEMQSMLVTLFVDGDMKTIGHPQDIAIDGSQLNRVLSDSEIYPLFATYETFDAQLGYWVSHPINLIDIKSMAHSERFKSGSQIWIYSKEFIREQLNGSGRNEDASSSQSAQQLAAIDATGLSLEADSQFLNNLEQVSTRTNVPASQLEIMASLARFVSGAVTLPGYYPIASDVTLAQVLAAAGGISADGDTTKIQVETQSVRGGRIIAGAVIAYDQSKTSLSSVRLNGRYAIRIPQLVNEIATGTVTLQGEVMRPGEYLFARDETVHDLIRRAGGLTSVAYPLGAVFTRENLKQSEQDYNDLLATQLEQAVLQVANSSTTNTSDQVQAVLGYAQQLRMQEATGRMSVNVSLENQDVPVFLENGDTLMIPKRPSHVTVIGAVNRNTTASYAPGKGLAAYLAAAGGATRVADARRIYLLLPNGESMPLADETPIPPGSAIVVPPRTDYLSVLGLTDLVSRVLGNIATSFLAINNVK